MLKSNIKYAVLFLLLTSAAIYYAIKPSFSSKSYTSTAELSNVVSQHDSDFVSGKTVEGDKVPYVKHPLPASTGMYDKHAAAQLTNEEKLEAEAWFSKKGQVGKVNSEYLAYSAETLEKLVKNGDVDAIVPLGFEYLRRSGPEAAYQFYLEMAARGYTHVFSQIGNLEASYKYEKASSAEEQSLAAMEVLAAYNVAKLRGDRWPNIADASFFVRRNKIELSEQDKRKIEVRSQEIYDQVQQKRVELGLGQFDNSVPESVKKYFDYLESVTSKSVP